MTHPFTGEVLSCILDLLKKVDPQSKAYCVNIYVEEKYLKDILDANMSFMEEVLGIWEIWIAYDIRPQDADYEIFPEIYILKKDKRVAQRVVIDFLPF